MPGPGSDTATELALPRLDGSALVVLAVSPRSAKKNRRVGTAQRKGLLGWGGMRRKYDGKLHRWQVTGLGAVWVRDPNGGAKRWSHREKHVWGGRCALWQGSCCCAACPNGRRCAFLCSVPRVAQLIALFGPASLARGHRFQMPGATHLIPLSSCPSGRSSTWAGNKT